MILRGDSMHLCCQSASACELIILPDIEMETGDEKWISLQAERIFVTESPAVWP
ncbi:lipoprotein, putative [Methanothrix soehngenii GP6]|uniref:Lipoprotein, putative n=1 Tax=Methanothrix soehngenii (strain ATCC 5969 / DSM 3671 / JCM 10134 / NBRC 103675 / OCM 69 / GP-6) TaxID=990316 RepID=F4BT10_METSG|nr:lipoprotein, putative [Methanothrix soehngenii GP6]